MAKTYRSRHDGRLSEEGRIRRRVVQIRQWRAHLPDQPVASHPSLLARPASTAAGFFRWSRFLGTTARSRQHWPTTPTGRRRSERGPNVAQQRPILGPLAAATVPPTSPPRAGTALPGPDSQPVCGLRRRQSPRDSGRFMRHPSGAAGRPRRTCARRHRESRTFPSTVASER